MPILIRFLAVVAVAAVLTSVSVLALAPQVGAVLGANQSDEVPEIALDPLAARSVVLAADGSELSVLHDGENNRAPVALEEVPDVVVETVLAVEDEQFWEHGGVNVRATMRALLTNVAAGDILQGGSTVTQQLVKNTLLTPEQSFDRKAQEAVLAVRMEEQLSKAEILERYLNTVYLGSGASGFQAAAERYYGKDVGDLGRAEAVFLAGLIQYPSGYDPYRFPEAARDRRDEVVDRLLSIGRIDEAEAEELRAAPIPTEKHELASARNYFADQVVQELLEDPRIPGRNRAERRDTVFTGGLTIKTTLDPRLQFFAQVATNENLPPNRGYDYTDPVTGVRMVGEFTAAVASVEPATGAVRAMIGGPGFEEAQNNVVTQRWPGRQPGSAFKPVVAAAHLENGGSPLDTVSGSMPCAVPMPPPQTYSPTNYGGDRGGTGDLRTQMVRSNNCAFVRLGQHVGIDKVAEMGRALGITTDIPEYPSTALGPIGVRPIDLAAVYATFANGGMYNEPYFVEEVLDRDGNVVLRHEPQPRRAVSEATAAWINDFLADNVQRGTGTRARFLDGRVASGKTGTTNRNVDAWFVGSISQMTTAVWMGATEGSVPMSTIEGAGRGVTGGLFPAQIWGAYMNGAFAGAEHRAFAPPPPPPPGRFVAMPHEAAARQRQAEEERRRAAPPPAPAPAPAPTPPPPAPAPPAAEPPSEQAAAPERRRDRVGEAIDELFGRDG